MYFRLIATMMIVLALVVGCGKSEPTDAPEPTATATPVPPTDTPEPTATATPVPPTDTPEPTATAMPTETPVPPSPTMTDTPASTATALPPAPTIEPLALLGAPVPLSELQPITLENAQDVQLLSTLQIPEYQFSPSKAGQCTVAFSPDGKLVSGVCAKSLVPIWEVETGNLLHASEGKKREVGLAFSPDGEIMLTGGWSGNISIWDSISGERIETFGEFDDPVWDLDMSPDKSMLATVQLDWDGLLSNPPDDDSLRDIRMWDMVSKEQIWSTKQGRNYSLCVDHHPSGETVAVGKTRGDVFIFDAATGQELFAFNTSSQPYQAGAGNMGDLAYSPAGNFLAAGSDDKKVWLWETENYELLFALEGHQGYINGVVFSSDESVLISGSDDATVGIWDLQGQQLLKILAGHAITILRVDLNSDGTLIASISWDGTVKLWGIPTDE